MPVIDCHTHIWKNLSGIRRGHLQVVPCKYGKVIVGEEKKRIFPPSFTKVKCPGTLMLEYMDWVGIDRAVLLPAPFYGDQNQYISYWVRRYPKKFVGFALIDPRRVPGAIDKLRYTVRTLGLKGVKFEVPDTPFLLDDAQIMPLWKKIAQLDILVAIDLGWGEGPYDFQIRRLEKVMQKFSNITFILTHLGVSRLWDLAQKYPFPILQQTLDLSKYPNVWFDLASLPSFCGDEEYPYPRAQQILKATYERIGAGRLLWGSDFPGALRRCTYQQCIDFIRNHCGFFEKEDKESVLWKNAAKLFGFIST